jgi:hypothetical protein
MKPLQRMQCRHRLTTRKRRRNWDGRFSAIVFALLARERVNVGAIAEETGLGGQTVYRIKDDPAAGRKPP